MNSSTRRRGTIALAAGILGVGSYAFIGGAAEAVPPAQSTCTFGARSITPANGWQPLGLAVSIDNGTVSRRILAQLATDMGVDSGAEVRVGYRIDSGPVQEKKFGPGNLANHTEFWQTRSTLALIPMAKGTHRVQPYWRISGAAGKRGYVENSCFTVEGRTS